MSYRYENLYIMHYGVGHDKGGHSGRYPWGSGENPYGGKKNITEKDAKNFNKKYSQHIYKNKKLLDTSKEKMDFQNATFSLIKHISEISGLTNQDVINKIKNDKEAREIFVNAMLDDNTTANDRKVKDIIKSYRELFNKINGQSTREIEDFLREYDAKTLYDSKNLGKNLNDVSRIIKNAYDKDIGVLDKNSKYRSTDDKEWLDQFLVYAFG